jgi:signal transduction histidine kinase
MSKGKSRSDQNSQSEDENLRRVIFEYEARLLDVADLIARVRHEINNPLTGLMGQAQLMLREELPETARRRVQIIESLARRVRDTVAELRVVQRPNLTTNIAPTKNGKTLQEECAEAAPPQQTKH